MAEVVQSVGQESACQTEQEYPIIQAALLLQLLHEAVAARRSLIRGLEQVDSIIDQLKAEQLKQ